MKHLLDFVHTFYLARPPSSQGGAALTLGCWVASFQDAWFPRRGIIHQPRATPWVTVPGTSTRLLDMMTYARGLPSFQEDEQCFGQAPNVEPRQSGSLGRLVPPEHEFRWGKDLLPEKAEAFVPCW